MDCNICSRRFRSRLPPVCPSCARTALYQPRIHHLTTLLEKESLGKQVEAIITPPSTGLESTLPAGATVVNASEGVKTLEIKRLRAEQAETEERIALITQQAKLLQEQIDKAKQELGTARSTNAEKRKLLAARQSDLEERQAQDVDSIQASIQRYERKLRKRHTITIGGRAELCREAAELSGLATSRRRRRKDGSLAEVYVIGGLTIPSLTDLNSVHHDHVTASLGHVCRLLVTCCFYLAVRLPAEVILPHANYPHPTVFSIQSSYQHRNIPYPGSTSAPSSSVSLGTSKVLEQHPRPRPRVLCLDRPLPRLAKEDPAAYAYFVEGVTLLAWDIAWLCRSQGVSGIDTWEDVCAIGKNMHRLFVVTPNAQRLNSRNEGTSTRPPVSRTSTATTVTPSNEPDLPIKLGTFSHNSTQALLCAPEGNELMHGWKLTVPAKVIDKVKSYLLTEMSGADWEMLEEREWMEERDDEQAVLVGGTRRDDAAQGAVHPAMSVMTIAGAPLGDAFEARAKGTSGWTRVKSRGGEGTS
ncbi:hypothetical protein LTR66_001053 [Elasticomyces elasticus]|nr:hypothetical protein LTR66_001053 [Elasticomyces elasticus]